MARRSPLDDLRHALEDLAAGPISDHEKGRITGLLEAAWDDLQGGDAEGMTPAKLRGRTEDMTWRPPCLAFNIGRHGGTVLGSTREERHQWEVDVQRGTATLQSTNRYRQLQPRARPVDVEPLVTEIVQAIKRHAEHPALTWLPPTRVRVTASKLPALALRSAYRQTADGRRRRFIERLEPQLAGIGWSRLAGSGRFDFERKTVRAAQGKPGSSSSAP
jgi:hypothetical protein